MPRHSSPTKHRARRSTSAELAYRAGIVERTIELNRPAAISVRERSMRTATRYGSVLAMFAALIWVYDLGSFMHG